MPHFSTRLTWTTGLSEPLLASKHMPMPTTATGEDSRAILPTPKNLFDQTPVKSTTPLSLLLEDIAVTTENSWVCHKRIPKRASLELAFELFASGMTSVPKICHELDVHGLCQPMSVISMASPVCHHNS